MPPITRIIARAVQTHGMIVRDKTARALQFFAEDPTPTATDPYPRLFGRQTPTSSSPASLHPPTSLQNGPPHHTSTVTGP